MSAESPLPQDAGQSRAAGKPSRTARAFAIAAAVPPTTLAGFGFDFVVSRIRVNGQLLVALDFGVRFKLVLVTARPALGLLLLISGTILLKHAEIMIRILQIIFGLDPIARQLGVARQRLVFF